MPIFVFCQVMARGSTGKLSPLQTSPLKQYKAEDGE
jgi:hypothetical protein